MEEEAEGEAFSQAIENCTRAGRGRKATQKALESSEQAKPPKRGPESGGHGRVITNLKSIENLFGKTEMDLVSVFINTLYKFTYHHIVIGIIIAAIILICKL
jgi:hypothetical protein